MSRSRKVDVRVWGDSRVRMLSPSKPSGLVYWLTALESRLGRAALNLLLKITSEVALEMARTASTDRFDGVAGETAAEFEKMAGELLDWAQRVQETGGPRAR